MTRTRNLPERKDIRKELRNEGTASEAVLWSMLKGRKLEGRKFRRQDGFGNYTVDFHCPDERLVIEVDGSIHDDPGQVEHDRKRDAWLRSLGLRILRFDNKQILDDTESVLEEIKKYLTLQGQVRTEYRAEIRTRSQRTRKSRSQESAHKSHAHHP